MLAPISDEDWPATLAHLKGGFTARANVYRTMAHHPALLAAWQSLRTHIVTESSLPDDALEVVILRTGHRRGAAYEWAHHIVRARAAGMGDSRIATLSGSPGSMDPEDAILARAVDALIEESALPEDLQRAVAERYGEAGLLDLMATVGFYTILAYVVKSSATPLDADIEAALAAAPFDPS